MKQQSHALNLGELPNTTMSTSEGSQGSQKNHSKGVQLIKQKEEAKESESEAVKAGVYALRAKLSSEQGETLESLRYILQVSEETFSSSIKNIVNSQTEDFKLDCLKLIKFAVSSKKNFKKYIEAMENKLDADRHEKKGEYDIKNDPHHKFLVQTNGYLHNTKDLVWQPVSDELRKPIIKEVQKVLIDIYKKHINELESSISGVQKQ